MYVRLAAIFAVLFFVIQTAHAQDVIKRVEYEGVYVGPGAEGVIFSVAGGPVMTASLDPKRQHQGRVYNVPPGTLKVEGTVPVEALTRGTFVSFESFIERRKRAAEPLKEISIIQRSPTTAFGLFDATPPGAFDAPEPPAGTQYLSVAGMISGMPRQNTIMVTVPGSAVRAELADDVKVNLNTSELRFAAKGDKIRVVGFEVDATKVFATEVVITHDPDKQPEAEVAAGPVPVEGGGLFAAPADEPAPADGPKPEASKKVRGVILRLN